MAENKKRVVEVKARSSSDVARLLAAFDRATDHEKLEFESVLLDAARKAEQEGRVEDAIRIKQRILQLRAGR
jgi:hypothetical protein